MGQKGGIKEQGWGHGPSDTDPVTHPSPSQVLGTQPPSASQCPHPAPPKNAPGPYLHVPKGLHQGHHLQLVELRQLLDPVDVLLAGEGRDSLSAGHMGTRTFPPPPPLPPPASCPTPGLLAAPYLWGLGFGATNIDPAEQGAGLPAAPCTARAQPRRGTPRLALVVPASPRPAQHQPQLTCKHTET